MSDEQFWLGIPSSEPLQEYQLGTRLHTYLKHDPASDPKRAID